MIFRLLCLIRGYVIVQISGYGKEKLINFLMRSDFRVWNVKHKKDHFEAKLKMKDFKQIRPYVRRADCKVRIKSKHGLPYWLRKLKVRKSLLVGVVVAVMMLYLLSSFIWSVEIHGLSELSEEKIVNLLKDSGFEYGMLKHTVDIEELEKKIESHRKIAWADIELQGTKLDVEIVEKVLVEEKDRTDKVVDVVAKKTGLIEEIIVLKGKPVVKEGELVQAGERLISGTRKYYPQVPQQEELSTEEKEELEPKIEKMAADGIVKAKVWYRSYAEAKLVDYYQQETAEVLDSISVRYNNSEFNVYGPDKPPFAQFKIEIAVKSLPSWRNIDFPIELIRRRYIKVKDFKERLSLAEAKELAKKRALEKVLDRVSEDAEIINKKFEIISENQKVNNIVRIKALITTKEDIALQKVKTVQ
ncbi:sporulation protein YqfD [Acetohalobium arabaticum]|uniref:Sporulation protein YqfD n=1 Tax=Acetohalobium arabaticum (strain ATCC 49924 / DSM 5501 / Z-7288) TaxID=574087 RepID=D9QV99_ACEAZ|nr:sporulation protein YqfD [Acetohalobium arabaticum]ADL12158.1 sporulation protein YqfD [Acetohalobium arabaticum DSM 5501]